VLASTCIRLRLQRVCGCRVPGAEHGVEQVIPTFGTTTEQLMPLHDWLAAYGVTEVAMESAGTQLHRCLSPIS
jgi:hypothetical protein